MGTVRCGDAHGQQQHCNRLHHSRDDWLVITGHWPLIKATINSMNPWPSDNSPDGWCNGVRNNFLAHFRPGDADQFSYQCYIACYDIDMNNNKYIAWKTT